MNVSKIFITLLVTLTFLLNANTTSANVAQVDGGPRTVIQAMTDVIIEQPTAGHLETTIVNSAGNAVIEAETESRSTVISVEGLEPGIYTVETVDDNGDYQEFSVIVQ